MIRQILKWLVLAPLAIVLIAFAVANRQWVNLSLDPFSSEPPALAISLPLFLVVLLVLILGVIVGGIAAWLGQRRWRKAAPSAFEPTSPEARAAIEAIVRDSYGWFRGLVRDRRHFDDAALDRVADGRVFTGRQAMELKLVDQLGDEQAAVDWLAAEKGIDPKLRVIDWQLRSRFGDLTFLHLAAVRALQALGLDRLAEFSAVRAVERVNLDGLLALWHPSSAN